DRGPAPRLLEPVNYGQLVVNDPPRPSSSVTGIGFTVVCWSGVVTAGSSWFHVVSATDASPYILIAIVRSALGSNVSEIRCSFIKESRMLVYEPATEGGKAGSPPTVVRTAFTAVRAAGRFPSPSWISASINTSVSSRRI